MFSDEVSDHVIRAMNELGIPYMVVGSLSSNVYGVPRATRDADFVVEASSEAISELTKCLAPRLEADPQLSFETVTGTSRYVLKVPGAPFKVELFLLSDDPYDIARFGRRVRREVDGEPVYLPTVEDVVVTKLLWYGRVARLKDLDDIQKVIAVQGSRIDWPYVESWCDRHGTRALLDQIRSSIPPA